MSLDHGEAGKWGLHPRCMCSPPSPMGSGDSSIWAFLCCFPRFICGWLDQKCSDQCSEQILYRRHCCSTFLGCKGFSEYKALESRWGCGLTGINGRNVKDGNTGIKPRSMYKRKHCIAYRWRLVCVRPPPQRWQPGAWAVFAHVPTLTPLHTPMRQFHFATMLSVS